MRTRLTEVASLSRALALGAFTGVTDALSQFLQAALVASRFGKVLRLNHQAATLDGRDFHLSQGPIVLADTAASVELAKVLDRIRILPVGVGLGAPSITCRRMGRPVLLIMTLPVDRSIGEPFRGAVALLLLTDLSKPLPRPQISVVSATFGLIMAEAPVAIALGEGSSTALVSNQLGLSVETERPI